MPTLLGNSDSRGAYVETVRSNVDVLLLLGTFVVLSVVTSSYGEAGLFPLVFLVSGAIFLSIEFGSHFLPGGYKEKVRNVLTREMAEVNLDDAGDEIDEEPSKSKTDVLLVIGMLGVFFLLTYVVNFLVGSIVFTLVTGYALGLRDYRLIVLTIVLTAMVYGIFGEIINTPILE